MSTRLRKRFQPYFVFAQASGFKYGIDPLLILAIMDRESACGLSLLPPGPGGVGPGGSDLGLMQINHHAHPLFAAEKLPDGSPAWADAARNIDYGAKVLHDALVAFDNDEYFAAAAYNAGVHAVKAALLDVPPDSRLTTRHLVADSVTKGRNYASDVVDRRTQLRVALAEEPHA